MKTLTITDARQNLGHWLKLAANGEEVGVIVGSDIIALRKVKIQSADYAYQDMDCLPCRSRRLRNASTQRLSRKASQDSQGIQRGLARVARMKLETAKSFSRSLTRRSDAELQQVAIAMQEAAVSFGGRIRIPESIFDA